MTTHRAIVQHDYQTHSDNGCGCRAFCNTCTWSGPWVKFASTAQRHADAHSSQRVGKHRTSR